jgi:hypothetical protein
MGSKRSHRNRHDKPRPKSTREAVPLVARPAPQKAPPIVYGKPFTLLEDRSKATFTFSGGAWVPYSMTIAECLESNCQVQRLPQEVNRMIRYEVRCPIGQ